MTIVSVLKGIFTDLLYPGIIIFILWYLFTLVNGMIKSTGSLSSGIRRLAAALLPLIALVFVLILENDYTIIQVRTFLNSFQGLYQFVIGLILGFQLVQTRKYFINVCVDIQVVPCILFTATFSSFLLYAIMRGAVGSIQALLFGMVVAGIIIVIFTGLKESPNKHSPMLVLIIFLVLDAGVVAGSMLKPEWVLREKTSREISKVRASLVELEKSNQLNHKEKVYIELLESSLTHKDIDNDNKIDVDIDLEKFKRAMKQLEKMGSHHKIPTEIILDLLEASYPEACAGNEKYKEIAISIIHYVTKMKVLEACELLANMHALGGDKEVARKVQVASVELCGY